MDAQTLTTGDIWKDDLLNRGEDAVFLHSFLINKMAERQANNIPGSYVLNIDAEWGAGKTFFLNKFGKYLEEQGHIVVSIDAWRDDYVDDPFVAVLAAINETFKKHDKAKTVKLTDQLRAAKNSAAPIIMSVVKGVVKTAATKIVGEGLSEAAEAYTNEVGQAAVNSAVDQTATEFSKLTDKFTDKIIADFSTQSKSSEDFRKHLGEALKSISDSTDISLPLFILIDELDRCRPPYAVALLERVKHLFDIDNVVFVFATNSGQLQHSITGAYGPNFDGYRYLKRFFDKTYKLEKSSPEEFIKMAAVNFNYQKIDAPGSESDKKIKAVKFLTQCSKAYDLDLRDIEHIIDIIKSVIDVWRHENVPLDLAMIFPLAHTYYKNGTAGWDLALNSIPNDFEVGLNFYRDGQELKINIYKIFLCYKNAIKSSSSAFSLINGASTSLAHEHAGRIISREINGRGSETPSRYLTLPSQIERAGQMSEIHSTYE